MASRPRPERGHILLVVIVLVTLVTVMLSMSIRPTLTAGARMKERELLYRGKHMAEGIRRFYHKYGRFPFELEELLEQEPGFVRRIYADPMTVDGEWNLVYLVPEDRGSVQALSGGLARAVGASDEEENSENEKNEDQPGLNRSVDSAFRIRSRQITGIRSKSNEEGLRVHQDSRIYADWLFTALPRVEINLEDIIEGGKPPGESGN